LTTNQPNPAACSARKLRAAYLGGAYSYYDIAGAQCTYLNTRSPSVNPYVFGIEETLVGVRLFDVFAESSSNQRWINLQ
jgi:hypothetical protein